MLNTLFTLLMVLGSSAGRYQWPSWGGPNGNFTVSAKGLTATFADSPPKRLWERPLGDGYSSIVTDGARLYTMYRRGNEEVVIAVDSATGLTKWEYAYDASFQPGMVMENGPGPHATPLVLGTKVYTIGVLGTMHSFDRKSGKVLWRKDLFKHFPANSSMVHGFAVSPVACGNKILVKLGDQGRALLALDANDGSVLWQKHSFLYTGSTPILIDVDRQEQLVTTFNGVVAGFDPGNGELLWSYPPQNSGSGQAKSNGPGYVISTPVWGPGNLLFTSSAGGGGASVLHLVQSGGKTRAQELWSNNFMRIHHSNAIRIGDYVYASSGDFGPSPLMAVDIRTGKVAWRDRSFGKANMVLAGDKVIVLDEGGDLARVVLAPEGLRVRWRVPLLKGNAWTTPTLAGTRLYVRDRRTMIALDLR
jgi:outer membrane protein assembly factor BamB